MKLDPGKISSRQFSILISLYIIGSAILNIPSMIGSIAKQDSWISATLALAIGLIILPLYIHLGNRFSHAIFSWYTEKVLSKWVGRVVSLLFFVSYPFLITILSLRNVGDFVTIEVMTDTPIQAIHFMMILVVIMGVRLGLEPLARTAELFFPFVILLVLIFTLLVSPQIDIHNIQPVLEEGFKPVLNASLVAIAYPFVESGILIVLFPHVNRSQQNGKSLFTGILIGGLFLVIVTILSTLVLGEDMANRLYPSYTLAKKISIGNFLERIEVIIAVIWIVTIFIRVTLLFYVSIIGIAQTLNLKEYRFLIYPMAIILITFSQIVFPNTAYFQSFTPTWTIHALIMGFCFPLVLWVIGSFKK
ncbi:GerAB/ArcD/ProY family transporter [Paenibacillus crassostreae]|uniref:GerAB/ArcD/ProY family transporter n=1 Tax=Paenibacillus crassostreae TaxID=1763538 RepID=UPI0008396125|nr:endospore germination permease [Paenibacillus crassostreae]AOZ92162.1 spore gernimation protein [Paenibacillus crassostreae]